MPRDARTQAGTLVQYLEKARQASG